MQSSSGQYPLVRPGITVNRAAGGKVKLGPAEVAAHRAGSVSVAGTRLCRLFHKAEVATAKRTLGLKVRQMRKAPVAPH